MSAIRHRSTGLAALCASLLPALLAGCETTSTIPTDSRLVGTWRLDHGASDDADAVVAKAVNHAESRFRQRMARYLPGGGEPGPGTPGTGQSPPDESSEGPDYSLDIPGDRFGGPGLIGPDFRGLRRRLQQALRPPAMLQLGLDEDVVTVTDDQLPPRAYRVDEKLSRIDEYGTAIITPRFEHERFVLKSNYTSHAQRIDSYEVDRASGTLKLTEQVSDPTAGKIIVHSIYRRG